MKRQLIQIVTINGEEHKEADVDNDMFLALSLLGIRIGKARPDLGKDYLQSRTDILTHVGRLMASGSTRIFDMSEQLDVDVKWAWALDVEGPKEDEPDPLSPCCDKVMTPGGIRGTPTMAMPMSSLLDRRGIGK